MIYLPHCAIKIILYGNSFSTEFYITLKCVFYLKIVLALLNITKFVYKFACICRCIYLWHLDILELYSNVMYSVRHMNALWIIHFLSFNEFLQLLYFTFAFSSLWLREIYSKSFDLSESSKWRQNHRVSCSKWRHSFSMT